MYNDNRLLANETIVSDILTFSSFLEDIDIQNREYIPCPRKSLAKSSWYFFFFSLYVYIEWYRNEIFSFRRKSRRTFCSYFLFFVFLSLSFFSLYPFHSPIRAPPPSNYFLTRLSASFTSFIYYVIRALFDHFLFPRLTRLTRVMHVIRRFIIIIIFIIFFFSSALKNYLTALWLTAGSKETYRYIMLHCFSIIITIIDFINPPFSLFPNTPAHSPTLSSLIFLFTRANQTFSHVEHLRTSAFLFFFFPFSFFYIYICIYISLHSLLHTHAFGCSLIVSYYYFFFFWIIPSVEEAVVDDQVRSKKKKNERWRVYRGDNLTFDWRISDQKGYKGSIITRNERFLIFPLGSSSNFLPGHLVYTSLWVYSFAYYRTVYVVCRLLFTFACRQLHDNFTLRLQKEREYLNVYALFIYLFIYFFFPLILKSFLGLLLKKKFSRSSPLWTPVSLPLLFFLFVSFFLLPFRNFW